MGHPTKHPIDPDTGLCDICDRDAIRDIRLGRRPARRVVYVDREEGVISRPPEEERIVYVQVRKSSFSSSDSLRNVRFRRNVHTSSKKILSLK